MAVRPDLVRVSRIGGLGFSPLHVPRTGLLAGELAVQLLDLRHQIGIKEGNLDTSIAEAQLAPAADCVVGVKLADHDPGDPALDDSLDTRDLRVIARRARF